MRLARAVRAFLAVGLAVAFVAAVFYDLKVAAAIGSPMGVAMIYYFEKEPTS